MIPHLSTKYIRTRKTITFHLYKYVVLPQSPAACRMLAIQNHLYNLRYVSLSTLLSREHRSRKGVVPLIPLADIKNNLDVMNVRAMGNNNDPARATVTTFIVATRKS